MSWWDSFMKWLRSLPAPKPPAPPAPPTEPVPSAQPTEPVPSAQPQPIQRRVQLVIYNPKIPSAGGRKLTDVLGWRDPDQLARDCAADLLRVSGGLVDFQVVDRIEVDGWPVKIDGFCYTPDQYMTCWRNKGGWHDPDAVDYREIIASFSLLQRVSSGEIDEVWLFGSPSAGFYESIMAGPGAFWCNAPELGGTAAAGRRFIIMGFSFERGVGEMLESFSHRVESCLEQAWRRWKGDVSHNLWEQFIRYDLVAPGKANCGNVHFALNSVRDYDWGNTRFVSSNCDDWLNFPSFTGAVRQVNCADWGNGDIRGHHTWWLERLPRAAGQSYGIANNWWQFAVDPNTVT